MGQSSEPNRPMDLDLRIWGRNGPGKLYGGGCQCNFRKMGEARVAQALKQDMPMDLRKVGAGMAPDKGTKH
jgi:hypothetical protein